MSDISALRRTLIEYKFELFLLERGHTSEIFSSKEDCLKSIEMIKSQLEGTEEPLPIKCSSFEEVKSMFGKYGADRNYIVNAKGMDEAELKNIENFIIANT